MEKLINLDTTLRHLSSLHRRCCLSSRGIQCFARRHSENPCPTHEILRVSSTANSMCNGYRQRTGSTFPSTRHERSEQSKCHKKLGSFPSYVIYISDAFRMRRMSGNTTPFHTYRQQSHDHIIIAIPTRMHHHPEPLPRDPLIHRFPIRMVPNLHKSSILVLDALLLLAIPQPG